MATNENIEHTEDEEGRLVEEINRDLIELTGMDDPDHLDVQAAYETLRARYAAKLKAMEARLDRIQARMKNGAAAREAELTEQDQRIVALEDKMVMQDNALQELEAVNEELENFNKELKTVNEELNTVNEDLNTVNEDLKTELKTSNNTTAFLKKKLNAELEGRDKLVAQDVARELENMSLNGKKDNKEGTSEELTHKKKKKKAKAGKPKLCEKYVRGKCDAGDHCELLHEGLVSVHSA